MKNKIPVAEIFGPTIQGEGPNVGIKTLFVRVAGCDFKCNWCDSKFAWHIDTQTMVCEPEQLFDKVFQRCIETNTSHVILTGGNPCLYNFESFIDLCHEQSISVDVETQGSILPKWLSYVNLVVISPKAPSSGQPDVFENVKQWLQKYAHLCIDVAIKIPVFNDEDFEFVKRYSVLTDYTTKLYISVGNTDTGEQGDISKRILTDYQKLIDKVMKSELKNVYVLPQVHTLVWGNKQGV